MRKTLIFYIVFLLSGCATTNNETLDLVLLPLMPVKMLVTLPFEAASHGMSKYGSGGSQTSFPFHGNWCGPGHPPKGTKPEPITIDALDEACKRHDECYEKRGYFSCFCDVQLMKEIHENGAVLRETPSKAIAVSEFFAQSYCKGCKQFRASTGIAYHCSDPKEFGCKMGFVNKRAEFASCPQ